MKVDAEFLYMRARAAGFRFSRTQDNLQVWPPTGIDAADWLAPIRECKQEFMRFVPAAPVLAYGLKRLEQLDLFGAGGPAPKPYFAALKKPRTAPSVQYDLFDDCQKQSKSKHAPIFTPEQVKKSIQLSLFTD